MWLQPGQDVPKASFVSSYISCSYFKQHINLPQLPEILPELRDKFCSLAMRMETGWKSPKKVAQHRLRPQGPSPPIIFASSLTPTCLSSILVWKTAARSLTSSRKSTLPSAAKEKISLL